MKFVIESSFWDLFPEARIGVVWATGLDNRRGATEATTLLETTGQEARNQVAESEIATYPAVAPWRDAYRAFGVKPAKYRSGIENLLRGAKAGGVRSINPLVDCYNAVALRHQLPCGGEDVATIVGDLRLTRAVGSEMFVPLGADDPQPPNPGEVIYRDDLGVVCRAWNWREAERTKLTEATTAAFLCLEWLPPLAPDALDRACTDLATLVADLLGASTRIALLDRTAPETDA